MASGGVKALKSNATYSNRLLYFVLSQGRQTRRDNSENNAELASCPFEAHLWGREVQKARPQVRRAALLFALEMIGFHHDTAVRLDGTILVDAPPLSLDFCPNGDKVALYTLVDAENTDCHHKYDFITNVR